MIVVLCDFNENGMPLSYFVRYHEILRHRLILSEYEANLKKSSPWSKSEHIIGNKRKTPVVTPPPRDKEGKSREKQLKNEAKKKEEKMRTPVE